MGVQTAMVDVRDSTPTRRTVVAAIAAGAVGVAAGQAGPAQAATGSPMILGVANTASTPTTLTATTTGIGLTVQCTGSAMFFNSATGNGVAGRTNAANRYGFSAANVGPAGGGAALAASGINNDGGPRQHRQPGQEGGGRPEPRDERPGNASQRPG